MKNGPIAPVVKNVWLECQVTKTLGTNREIEVKLQDDSTTKIIVHETLIGEIGDQNYVRVEDIGRKNKLVYIKLPQPSLQHGHNITVSQKVVKDKI